MHVSNCITAKGLCILSITWLAVILYCCEASEFCQKKFKSYNKDDQEEGRILRGLVNLRFVAEGRYEEHPASFIVNVCGNASKDDTLAAALITTNNRTTILGRVNNTSIIKGGEGDWMMMMFGSGDPYPDRGNCSGPRVAFVLINCNHNLSAENTMRFIKEAKEEKNKCFYMLEVHSHIICTVPIKISGGTVFVILLTFGITVYLIGGIIYRRIILGAKGLEQIPNIVFWRTVCEIARRTCSRLCCPKRGVLENSWDNLDQRSERDDDSLLS